jgi:hypothetical protein
MQGVSSCLHALSAAYIQLLKATTLKPRRSGSCRRRVSVRTADTSRAVAPRTVLRSSTVVCRRYSIGIQYDNSQLLLAPATQCPTSAVRVFGSVGVESDVWCCFWNLFVVLSYLNSQVPGGGVNRPRHLVYFCCLVLGSDLVSCRTCLYDMTGMY